MSEPERPFKRLSPLTPLVRSFILVVAAAASTWDDLLRGDLGPLAWGFLVLLVAGGVYGAASWMRTKYWIEADELRVDTGVISRQSRRIRVDRLQGIDISQPFVARLFGLAELKMDVAGGGAGEGSLAFLPLAEAQDLRATLLARRDAVRASRRPAAGGDDAAGGWAGGLPGSGACPRDARPAHPGAQPAAVPRDGCVRRRRTRVRRAVRGPRPVRRRRRSRPGAHRLRTHPVPQVVGLLRLHGLRDARGPAGPPRPLRARRSDHHPGASAGRGGQRADPVAPVRVGEARRGAWPATRAAWTRMVGPRPRR